MNHSLINASGSTHAKIALLAFAASIIFVAIVSASGFPKTDSAGARSYGPVVKATTMMNVAKSDSRLVR